MFEETARWIEISRNNLEEFLADMISVNADGRDFRKILKVILQPVILMRFCDLSNATGVVKVRPVTEPKMSTLLQGVVYGLLRIGNLSQPKTSTTSTVACVTYSRTSGSCMLHLIA
jgi:hypothetical protein